MKRVGRWLFNFAAAVSLVLGLATIPPWVRSYWASDWIEWHGDISGPTNIRIVTGRGECVVGCARLLHPYRETYWRRTTQTAYDLHGQWGRWASERRTLLWVITWGRTHYGDNSEGLTVLFPYWLLACVTFATPGFLIAMRLRKRRRKREGFCTKCGYDLRATPGRCPECGTIPAAAKGAAT